MGSSNPIHIAKVGAGSRLTLSNALLASKRDNAPSGRVWLFPLVWVREMPLTANVVFRAWALTGSPSTATTAGGSVVADWVWDPEEVVTRASEDEELAALASMVFRVDVYQKGRAWRFTIPQVIRDLELLPGTGSRCVVTRDGDLTCLWSPEAWLAWIRSISMK